MEKLQKLITMLTELSKRKFFGKIIISFESGTPTIMQVNEIMKL